MITDQAKSIMMHWLESNLEMPYPAQKTIELWAKKLNIPKKQIRNWMRNQRKKFKINKAKKKIFDSYDKKLMNAFYLQNKYPKKEDFTRMKNLTGKDQKQIRRWFQNKRFIDQK